MTKKIEQFLVWYIPILLVSRGTKAFMIPYIATKFSAQEDYALTYVTLTYVVTIFASLEHIVAAVWVWKNGTREQKRILWAAFALLTGLWGVLFFLAALIYERISLNNPQPTDQNLI